MNVLTEEIAGLAPRRVAEPKSADELAGVVRETAGDNLALSPIGSGTMLGLGNRPSRYDVAIRIKGLNRVVDYEPDDQVIVVEAGITLRELQAILREKKQRLAIDPLGGDEMTIGGMLATNAYGPRAERYGTLKDLIVGIEIVRADGAVARAGGKVVKNVAGFDVSKLMVGSLGTLAIVAKATFRLHPLPEATQTLAFTMPASSVYAFVLAMRDAQLEPAATVARLDGDACAVEVTFEGFGPGVDAQVKTCEKVAAKREASPSTALRAGSVEGQPAQLKVTYKPSEFERVAAIAKHATAFPTLGVMFVDLDVRDNGGPSTTLADARYARDDIGTLRSLSDVNVTIQRMPLDWYGMVDAWGPPPPSFSLMQALKDRFDPTRRLNPGRFVGGL